MTNVNQTRHLPPTGLVDAQLDWRDGSDATLHSVDIVGPSVEAPANCAARNCRWVGSSHDFCLRASASLHRHRVLYSTGIKQLIQRCGTHGPAFFVEWTGLGEW